MKRKYMMMMPVADWQAPTTLKVGDRAVVLHGEPRVAGTNLTDLRCGDTTVKNISARTGTITLANGFKFCADGFGLAVNKACVISSHHAIDRDSLGNPTQPIQPATKPGHCSTFSK